MVADTDWQSSDESIATIDSDGVVTAISKGECIAKLVYIDIDGNEWHGEYRIVVAAQSDAHMVTPINSFDCKYYDIFGRTVDNPSNGIYIRRLGHSVSKIVI